MSWYPGSAAGPGSHEPNHHHNSLPPQSQFQQQPPTTQLMYNNNQQQWHNPSQYQQQQPHQQPTTANANYLQQTGNFVPQQPHQQPYVTPPWNPTLPHNASNKSTPAPVTDMNQNFHTLPVAVAAPQPPPQQQQHQQQQNDGWGDWGDEWGAENSNNAVQNVQPPQQMPSLSAMPTGYPQQNSDHLHYQQATYGAPANYPAPPPEVANNHDPNMNQEAENVIADSFSASDNWNWNSNNDGPVDSNANQVELIRKPVVFNKMSSDAIDKLSCAPTTSDAYPTTNQPDDMKSRSFGTAAVEHPPRIGGVNASVPATTEPSVYNPPPIVNEGLDPLDLALMQMQGESHGPVYSAHVPDNGPNFFAPPSSTGIALPNSKPATSADSRVDNQKVSQEVSTATSNLSPEQLSRAVQLPPPPSSSMYPPAGPPPPSSTPALVNTSAIHAPESAGNPFKRTGAAVHRNLAFAPPTVPVPTAANTAPLVANMQQLPQAIVTPLPVHDLPVHHISNRDDRNEYLQTDQLSEEVRSTGVSESVPVETVDNLPPPGLSRLVLGETEEQHRTTITAFSQGTSQTQATESVPPSGFNRMVPGMDLADVPADIALQREADGQDDDTEAPQNFGATHSADLTDRNLYHVPGESLHDQQQQQQAGTGMGSHQPASRVVTGGDEMPFVVPNSVVSQTHHSDTHSLSSVGAVNVGVDVGNVMEITDEPRDLQPVDGENSRDDDNVRFNRQHGEQLSREEPIEGENDGDEVVISSGGAAAGIATVAVDVVTDLSSITGDNNPTNTLPKRKETSTGEDSDKEHSSYYKGKSGRGRNDAVDTGSLRRKSKEPPEFYDSESDNSEGRGRRKQFDRSYASERHRGGGADRDGRRRRGAPDESRHNRSERDRDRRYDDYDRSHGRGGDERRSKRYYEDDRDGPRRRPTTDGDAKKAEKERQYRKDRDRDRDRDGDRRGDHKDDRRYPNREKDRRYEYDDERYNRSGSRNTDRSRDPRYATSGYYGPNYGGYDHYAYYTQQQQQQMQYYENLRRTNPQAYAEWYRKYYMQASGLAAGAVTVPGAVAATGVATLGGAEIIQSQMPTDGRESVHSGRSSTNDKDRYHRMSMSTSGYYHQSLHADYQRGPEADSSFMDSTYGGASWSRPSYGHYPMQQQHQQSMTGGGRGHDLQQTSNHSQYGITDFRHGQQEKNDNRLTPHKYTNEHSRVSFSNGQLVCIKPKYTQNGIVHLIRVLDVGSLVTDNDVDKRLLAAYPGPLVRGVTHKKTVIEFCEERLKQGPLVFGGLAQPNRENRSTRSHANSMTSLCSVTQHSGSGQMSSSNQPQPFKASYNLLWNLLILLLRQNGTVVGTDIAELLIKNATDFPATNSSLVVIENTPLESAAAGGKSGLAGDGGDASLSDINSDESNGEESQRHAISSTATKTESVLSEDQITDKFRKHLLYGNVTEALDWATENNLWGHALFLASKMDRRSHLNVMMKFANKLALNDPLQTLYQLMSMRMPSFVTSVVDKKWGDWRPHLAMILSNTSQKPDLDRKAIMTLGDSLFHIGDVYGSHFCFLMAQVGFGKYEPWSADTTPASKLVLLGSSPARPFKEFSTSDAIIMTEIYEYAVTLNDESFMIAEYQPYKFTMATRLLDYGHQLKAFLYTEQLAKNIKRDPQKFDWCLVNNVCVFADRLRYYDPVQEKTIDGTDSQDSDTDHQKWIQDLKEMAGQFQNYQPHNGEHQQQPQASIDTQFAEINQQFNQLNLQYQNYDQPPNQGSSEHYGQSDGLQSNEAQSNQYSQPHDFDQKPTDHAEMLVSGQTNNYDAYGNQQQQQPHQEQPALQDQPQSTTGNFYDPSASMNNWNYGENAQVTTVPGGYDYFGQQDQQQQIPSEQQDYEPPRPQISMPSSMSQRPGFFDEGGGGNRGTGDGGGGQTKSADKQSSSNAAKGQLDKSGEPSSGWFGGIWGKLSLKPKNQMILPDDKNPSIVWDPDKKRWINTDEGETESESFKPPPKMADMNFPQPMPQMPSMQQQQASGMPPGMPPSFAPVPVQASMPTMTPMMNPSLVSQTSADDSSVVDGQNRQATNNLQSNQFKLQRNRTLKKSYVDVFNPSGTPMKGMENIMAPSSVPTIPQSGFFIPGSAPMDGH